MKSHVKLKEELSNAVENIKSIASYLQNKTNEKIAGVGAECEKASTLLRAIVANNELPQTYKVAVVGRFKAGKSSFVNELLGSKLAGEDTSPETAAITTFTYGEIVRARISLIDKETWSQQKQLYEQDPKNIEAHRAKMWESFSKPRKNADGSEQERFDLEKIERELLGGSESEVVIELNSSDGKNAEKVFREKLKLYTSGSKPHHCLVSSIDITTPAAILRDSIELVDTPGLGDTERFRVSLTQKAVENVDAILLLTKSGVAYGQEEKDFLISILRKGCVKQLVIVITQVDQTYEQHLKAARDNDDEADSIEARISAERNRVRSEIAKTLEELSGAESAVTMGYLEQFSSVDVVFTSVMAHRDSRAGDRPVVSLSKDDPGGLIDFKKRLSNVLSSESRLSSAAKQVLNQSRSVLDGLAETLDSKINALRSAKNGEEVERRLSSFRSQFEEICKGTAKELTETFLTFKSSTDIRLDAQNGVIEGIVLKAEKELNKFRIGDVGRHWRTRRNSNWGYLTELQSKVANRIFPLVQALLETHVEDFSSYVRRHERKLSKLTKEAELLATELQLGQFANFDIKRKLRESTSRVLERAQEQLVGEQEQIIKLLDSFVTQEVEDKITEQRLVVSSIWGRGTTVAQQREVNLFYDAIEKILSDALTSHLTSRNVGFARVLLAAAEHAPKETFQEVDVQLESAIENLRQAAEMTVMGEREAAEKLIQRISDKAGETVAHCTSLLEYLASISLEQEVLKETSESSFSDPLPGEIASNADDWASKLLVRATELFATHTLKDGDKGWPYNRIFTEEFFHGSERFRIVDPYLTKYHQLRNLSDFLLLIVENSRPKVVEIYTAHFAADNSESNKKFFNNLCTDFFQSHGVLLEIHHEAALHDRYIFSDKGFVAKMGRGLDIFKPSTGLAVHRQESRKVRACEIFVMQVPNIK